MDNLTTERLEYYAALPTKPAERKAIFMFEVRRMARQLLAYEQAAKNPVAWVATDSEGFPEYNGHNEFSAGCGVGAPLYAVPVLPKQPELLSIGELLQRLEEQTGEKWERSAQPEPENKIAQIKRQKALAWLKRVAYENPCMKEVKTCIEVLSAPAQPVIPATHKNTASPMLLNFYIAYHSWVKSGASENGLFLRNAGLCANAYDYFQLVGTSSDSLLEEMHNDFVVNGLNEKLPFNDDPDHYEKESKNALCHLNTARAQWVEAKAQPVIPEQCQRISDDDLVAVPRSVLACAGYAYGKAGMKDGKAYAQLKKYQFAPAITAQPVSEPSQLPDGIGVNGASIWRDVAPEKYCQFVTDNYANYQGAWLCGKSAEVLCYLLSMSGYEGKKVSTEINGVGHIYVRCGDLILDPTIKQFGDYPEISTGKHPAAPAQESE